MRTIHFFNFSDGGAAFKSHPVPFATIDVILKELKKAKLLPPNRLDARYDANADLKAAVTGSIYDGMRVVARFRVIDEPV